MSIIFKMAAGWNKHFISCKLFIPRYIMEKGYFWHDPEKNFKSHLKKKHYVFLYLNSMYLFKTVRELVE